MAKPKTVHDCWKLARMHAEMYQRMAHRARSGGIRAICLAKRDAVDRLAQTIRYGKQRRKARREKVKR
jgi:hypothetical protein